jgi:stage IV sporulation protein FB
MSIDFVHGSIWRSLMNWNLVMIAFNMIPAFPMDGGRVLRALLAMVFDYGRATRLAASIGQSIAIFGFMATLFWIHSPFLLVIAFFIFMSAGQEAAMVTEEESSRGLTIGNAMLTDFHTLPPHATLKDAVELLLAGTQHDFPIVDAAGGFVGLLTRTALITGLSEHGKDHPAASVMETCETQLDPADPLAKGMECLRNASCPALPVISPINGRLVGLLTGENIGEVMMVRAALQAAR